MFELRQGSMHQKSLQQLTTAMGSMLKRPSSFTAPAGLKLPFNVGNSGCAGAAEPKPAAGPSPCEAANRDELKLIVFF
jgi:hypothetical protein